MTNDELIENLTDARLRQRACELFLLEIEELRTCIKGLEGGINGEIEELYKELQTRTQASGDPQEIHDQRVTHQLKCPN